MSTVFQFNLQVATSSIGYGVLTDQYNNPLPLQPVTAELLNVAIATVSFPDGNVTDVNGRVRLSLVGQLAGQTTLTLKNIRPNQNTPLFSNAAIINVTGTAPPSGVNTGVTNIQLTLNQ